MFTMETLEHPLAHALEETLIIGIFIFIALVAMDYLYVRSRGRLAAMVKRRPATQYLLGALMGAIPGCEGVYFAVSMHAHGLISFGALLAAFIATIGDEAFFMISVVPLTTLLLTGILFILGYLIGTGSDILMKRYLPHTDLHCQTPIIHKEVRFSWHHYWTEHLWEHIIKEHMIKILLWTFAAIFLIEFALDNYDLKALIAGNTFWLLIIAALVGLIPQTGPHFIFVAMFAEGAIPFSILFTNMIIQSGHALLPQLSISLKDSFLLKLIAFVAGLLLGGSLNLLGW